MKILMSIRELGTETGGKDKKNEVGNIEKNGRKVYRKWIVEDVIKVAGVCGKMNV